MTTTKNNIIRNEDWDGKVKKDFTVFEKDEKSNGFISIRMDIQNPNGVNLNTTTYGIYADFTTELEFGMRIDNDIETLENLVKWTKGITRDANKQIKKLKEKQELKEFEELI